MLAKYPATRHFVIDGVAMAEIDFTGMTILSQVVGDLQKDGITLSFARVNERVKASSRSRSIPRFARSRPTTASTRRLWRSARLSSPPIGEARS